MHARSAGHAGQIACQMLASGRMQHKSPEIGVIRSCLYRILRMQPLMTAYRACSPYGRTYTATVFADILSRMSYFDIRCTPSFIIGFMPTLDGLLTVVHTAVNT